MRSQNRTLLRFLSEALLLLPVLLVVPPAVAQTPVVNTIGLVNTASFARGPVAPGSAAALFGNNLAPSVVGASGLPLPTTLGGTTVTFGGVRAPLGFVSLGQINLQIPWELAGQTQASLTVTTSAGTSSPVTVGLTAAAPR